jgi:hypothetical protein
MLKICPVQCIGWLSLKQKYAKAELCVAKLCRVIIYSFKLMLLACPKKSYLTKSRSYLEISKYYIFFDFDFFFNVQNWDSQEGRDSCLKTNKYYVIFLTSRFRWIAFLMTCQQHKLRLSYARTKLWKAELCAAKISWGKTMPEQKCEKQRSQG